MAMMKGPYPYTQIDTEDSQVYKVHPSNFNLDPFVFYTQW